MKKIVILLWLLPTMIVAEFSTIDHCRRYLLKREIAHYRDIIHRKATTRIPFVYHCQQCATWEKSPFPIGFCIPDIKVVKQIPPKNRDFAFIIPGKLARYIYNTEADYYAGYQQSYFAITKKKGGWDCMRHYEILANGCIPYFLELDSCDDKTMHFIPRALIKEAMNLPGVSYLHIDHSIFDKKRYYEILNELLIYTRQYLTTRAMATYLLAKNNYSGTGKVLFLSNGTLPDYQRCCLLIGLKQVLGDKIIDAPKIPHIYTSYGDLGQIYPFGRGFTYTKVIDDIPLDRTNIETRIRNKEFELIIYGQVHSGCRYYDLVRQFYDQSKIIYICGADSHGGQCSESYRPNLFLREFN